MTLGELNQLSALQKKEELTKCCGASEWVRNMVSSFPFPDKQSLLGKADEIWSSLSPMDWLEAFAHHPQIGDLASLEKKFAATAAWASNEQAAVHEASSNTLKALAKGNREYEEKFGYIFIICATGKPVQAMWQALEARLHNTKEDELLIAAAEQAKITKLRLEKLLA